MEPNSVPARLDPNSQSECPECGTPRLRAIYGLPTIELANDPNVKLMGCLIDGEMPEWYCPECDNEVELG
jgi:hypothetical protein